MTEQDSYSAEQALSVLENSPAAVIVSDLETRELLYVGGAARRFVDPQYRDKPTACYRAFGFDAPCPTCPTGQISRTELFTRELESPETGKTYQLSGKLIDWDGRPAHVEYIWDVSKRKRLEKELIQTNEKMQEIIDAIPGGVAIYKISDIFETVYFSDGVPALTGYTAEEYREIVKRDAAELTYPEDTAMVVKTARRAIETHAAVDLEFRKQHRDGHIVWVHAQARQIGEDGGFPLLQCVFHNISALKETQLELNHLINSIPGGIASYRVEEGRTVTVFCSDGVIALSGYTREEYDRICRDDVFDMLYESDRERVRSAAQAAYESGEALDISYRVVHKSGNPIWIHLNGRRMGPLTKSARFYAIFTGLSAETRLFQAITNETADGIYVIDQSNYELLYANEVKGLFTKGKNCVGQKCYLALHGKNAPCSFCTLKDHAPDGQEHEMAVEGTDRVFLTRFRETDWNGIPVYVKYVRDATEEVGMRREKERLEVYFKTLAENLPGGISVIRCEPSGSTTLEYISEGFAAMTQMSVKEAEELYRDDVFAGVHPEDVKSIQTSFQESMESGEEHCEFTARFRRGDGSYIWVRDHVSMQEDPGGIQRIYSVYTDITQMVEEKEALRRQYEDILFQHYHTPGPDTLVLGHCNITQNKILEIRDATNSDLLKTFGDVREAFFTGLSALVVDENERQAFLDTYLNAPALAAFGRKDTERILDCFVKFPREEKGRYVRIKVNLVETPDTGDVTGILTVTDITEQTIAERILHQISVTSHDYVVDLDLGKDSYAVLTCNQDACRLPEAQGRHGERVAYMAENVVVPKDKETYARSLDPAEIRRRLKKGPYTFTYSVASEDGDIRTKNMTVSAIDLRLDRVCLVCTDITASVREQQGLLGMLACTFELMGFLDISGGSFTLYTRQAVLENLPPYVFADYGRMVEDFTNSFFSEEGKEDVRDQFRVETILRRLSEEPAGYDFVFTDVTEGEARYKQTNVLWGDVNHRTVCLVRADVTEILAAERESKQALSAALDLAEEANRAKSDFLSAMSHDIRTPMNAIMGMTTLAVAHLEERDRVADCLQKISAASKHLLSLINDVLDMSKIEQSKISLNRAAVSLPELTEEISAMLAPQAKAGGLEFDIRMQPLGHKAFYGDPLRINQILINLLSNAIKFTPAGGSVEFSVEEIPPVKDPARVRYRFTVRDTGIGMTEEFLTHLFDPFARGSGAARIEGTGLGLSITKGLVDQMGGEISVESQLGKGSAFRVELECEAAPEEEVRHTRDLPKSAAGSGQPFAGRTFLVAEDNAINAEILCELLKMYGAGTVVKTDGAQAVRAFQEAAPGTYDAILMDIQMPELNGYEAARAIRSMSRSDAKAIPIVAMTANAFAEDVQAALDAGMNAHVSKPIDVELLKAALGGVLGI